MILLRNHLRRRIVDACLAGWRRALGLPARSPQRTRWLRLARRFRTSAAADRFAASKKRKLPWAVIVGSFGFVFLFLLPLWAWELCYAPEPPAPEDCGHTSVAQRLDKGKEETFTFDTRCPLYASNIVLQAGGRYAIHVDAADSAWLDLENPAGRSASASTGDSPSAPG